MSILSASEHFSTSPGPQLTTVAALERNLYGRLDLVGLGLPCSETNGGDFGTGVQGVGLAVVCQCGARDLRGKGTNVVFLMAAMMILDME